MALRSVRYTHAPYPRTCAAVIAACALLLAVATVGAGRAEAQSGGTVSGDDLPQILQLECRSNCIASRATVRRTAAPAPVRIKPTGLLRIRGRNLASVSSIIFRGGRGSADDVPATPTAKFSGRVEVLVPPKAVSGPIVAFDEDLGASLPSKAAVAIPFQPISTDERFIWPVRGLTTGVFGENRGDHMHSGLDIALPTGSPIKAAAAGRVTLMASYGGYGLFTCIRHVTLTTCYAHQSQFLTSFGAVVQKGQVIGKVGNTGNSSGAHLHFEIRKGVTPQSPPLNPMLYLPR